MAKKEYNFNEDLVVNNRIYPVHFNLKSGDIGLPAYKVFSDDGKLHFEIELDTDMPGKYKIGHVYNLPEKGIRKDIEKEINQIFDQRKKDKKHPPSI